MKKKSKKTEQRELDDVWKRNVKERDNYICQICGKYLKDTPRSCHAHHILPKRMKGMRWDVNNGIVLCPNHHKLGIFSPHQNAIWFFGWMRANKPQQLNYIINKLARRHEPL